jgi:hypothetical protein
LKNRKLQGLFVIIVIFLLTGCLNLASITSGGADTTRDEEYMKIAENYIANSRLANVRLIALDAETGLPVSAAHVAYSQTSHDFVFAADPWTFGDNALQLRRSLGAEFIQGLFKWRQIEPTRGVFDFSEPDGLMSYLARHFPEQKVWVWIQGIVPVDQSDYAADGRFDPPEWSSWRDVTTNATAFENYKAGVYDYVHTIVLRYKMTVHVWMTNNEMNYLTRFTLYQNRIMPNAKLGTLSQAVELAKAIASAIRSADPNATIVLGTSTPHGKTTSELVDPFDFTKACLNAGVDFDAVALHVYPWNSWSPADYYEYFQKFQTLGKMVFPHETGYPSSLPTSTAPNWNEWKWNDVSEETQTRWLNYTLTLSFGSRNVMGYGYTLFQDDPAGSAFDREGWGLLKADGAPRKAYSTYKEIIMKFTSQGDGTTNSSGVFEFKAFAGDYSLKVDAPNYKERSIDLHIAELRNNELTLSLTESETSTATTGTTPTTVTTHTSSSPIQFMIGTSSQVLVSTAVIITAIVGLFVLKQTRRRRM